MPSADKSSRALAYRFVRRQKLKAKLACFPLNVDMVRWNRNEKENYGVCSASRRRNMGMWRNDS